MYTYDEALAASTEYFNGNDLSAKVFVDKYALRDNDNNILEKTPTETHRRLAKELARVESKYPNPMSEDEIFGLLDKFQYIIPQGSPTTAIGNPYGIMSIGNCFVLPQPHDSIGGILYTDQCMAQLYKRRCGVGVDISTIRPRGLSTQNAARTTDGISSFMERFSNTCRGIAINGRRGALLISISVHHPEVETFIKIKQNLASVTGANISVKFTKEFMDALKNDSTYEQKWPVDSPNPTVKKTVKAKDIWNLFIKCATKTSDPGAFFWPNVELNSIAGCYGPKDSRFYDITSNPCLSENGFVLTKQGLKKVKNIEHGDEIWSVEGWTTVLSIENKGKKDVYKYKTTAGYFVGTEDHNVYCDGKRIKIVESRGIDMLLGNYRPRKHLISEAIIEGEVTCVSPRCTDKIESYFTSDVDTIYSFLRGLFAGCGEIQRDNAMVRIGSLQDVEAIQLLLSSVGIASYYREYIFPYKTYSLHIDKAKFIESIGFKNQSVGMNELESRISQTVDINTIEYMGQEDVYTITVDNNTHSHWYNGLNVSNCGEIIMGSDSCRLTAINACGYVKNAFTPNASFDYELFAEHAAKAQKIMDDIVDIELECIDRIIAKVDSDPEPPYVKKIERDLWLYYREICELGRRTGLGLLAVADAIAMLNIRYGSPESIDFVEKLYKTLCINAYKSSCEMARDRGSFPLFEKELEKDCPYLQKILESSASVKYLYEKYGRRNIALLTTAPTGTIAILAKIGPYFYTSSGIEPALYFEAIRKKKGNPGDQNFRTDSIDEVGDHWMHFEVRHPGHQLWKDITGETDITKSPYYGLTLDSMQDNIPWQAHVQIQASAQKWICHSISKTLNLPKNVTEDVVSEAFLMAYETGCKGFTIYREGSRDGVIVSKDTTNSKITKTQAPKRPKTLPCDIHHVKIKGQDYYVLAGLLNEDIYEVFVTKTGIDKGWKNGKIVKVKKGHYQLQCEDKTINIDHINDEYEEAITRLVSTSLRHGSDIKYVIEQLGKVNGAITNFAKSIARALKHYVPDSISNEGCPECGANLRRSEGCLSCTCGYSKCG